MIFKKNYERKNDHHMAILFAWLKSSDKRYKMKENKFEVKQMNF